MKLITDFTIKSVELIKNDTGALSRFKVEIPKVSFYTVESVAGIEGDRGGGYGSSGTK